MLVMSAGASSPSRTVVVEGLRPITQAHFEVTDGSEQLSGLQVEPM